MKSADLKKDATYIFSGSHLNHMLQFVDKQDRPKRWIFKRLESHNPITDAVIVGSSRDPKEDIWSLKVQDLKNLLFECDKLGLRKTI